MLNCHPRVSSIKQNSFLYGKGNRPMLFISQRASQLFKYFPLKKARGWWCPLALWCDAIALVNLPGRYLPRSSHRQSSWRMTAAGNTTVHNRQQQSRPTPQQNRPAVGRCKILQQASILTMSRNNPGVWDGSSQFFYGLCCKHNDVMGMNLNRQWLGPFTGVGRPLSRDF